MVGQNILLTYPSSDNVISMKEWPLHRLSHTLQMLTGNYRDSTGKSECRDFKFMGIACIRAIPVVLKFPTLISIVIFVGNLILQGYYGDSLH